MHTMGQEEGYKHGPMSLVGEGECSSHLNRRKKRIARRENEERLKSNEVAMNPVAVMTPVNIELNTSIVKVGT